MKIRGFVISMDYEQKGVRLGKPFHYKEYTVVEDMMGSSEGIQSRFLARVEDPFLEEFEKKCRVCISKPYDIEFVMDTKTWVSKGKGYVDNEIPRIIAINEVNN